MQDSPGTHEGRAEASHHGRIAAYRRSNANWQRSTATSPSTRAKQRPPSSASSSPRIASKDDTGPEDRSVAHSAAFRARQSRSSAPTRRSNTSAACSGCAATSTRRTAGNAGDQGARLGHRLRSEDDGRRGIEPLRAAGGHEGFRGYVRRRRQAHRQQIDRRSFRLRARCLSDSALPSNDTDALRTKINHIELSRDDKAHRFVVTLERVPGRQPPRLSGARHRDRA